MPICKRDGFDLNHEETKNDTFHDNDLVFCCYITKRIFREYEHYFRHVMAINSTVWQCEVTGKDGLTYEEAEKSERLARKKMEQFKQSLRAPCLLIIEHARQSAVGTLNLIVYKFLRKRYFLNEEVTVRQKKPITCKVIGIKPSDDCPEPSSGIYEGTESLEYRLRAENGNEINVPFEQLHRSRAEFNMDNLGMFIKNNITRVDGILRPKPEVYKQYVTDPNISFSSIFIGKMPRYSPSKIKRPEPKDKKQTLDSNGKDKKQSTLNKYIVKSDEQAIVKSKPSQADIEAKAKSLAEKMERLRLAKKAEFEERERERIRWRAGLMARVTEECNNIFAKTDDLERNDQRIMPMYRPVVTLLPEQLLGDAFMLREFMHTYCGLLSGVEVFRQNLNFHELTRAFNTREVAGPLSDILLVLLGTIFDLQKEEEEECPVYYLKGGYFSHTSCEPYISISNAGRTHYYVKRHFSFKLHELPLDALTLTEVLRLHLLASGASISEKADRWRVMYRNGYSEREDPGLELRMQHPQIVRALKTQPIGQLAFEDIMRVINCLMSQILTYSATINIVEERMEKRIITKSKLRSLMFNENRRKLGVENAKRKLTTEHHQQCTSKEPELNAAQKQALDEELNRKIAELSAQSNREQRKYEQQLKPLQSELFNFLVYLGMDRCYRKYYVLESMPGLFIENVACSELDPCLAQPPLNKLPAEMRKLDLLPKQRKDLRSYLIKLYTAEKYNIAKRVNRKQSLENKENQENRLNGHAEPMDSAVDDEQPQQSSSPPTQTELLMCSGESGNCIVHDQGKRQVWSYIYQPEEIDALIGSLNPLGLRESELRDELCAWRSLIVQHVRKCPEDMLSLDTEQKRIKFRSDMHKEAQRQYGKANFGLPDGTELNAVMFPHLVDRILQFELDMFTGNLGRLKVKDMEKWREDVLNGDYDPQCKLQWGTPSVLHDDEAAGDSDNESHEDLDGLEFEKGDEAGLVKKPPKWAPYQDPDRYIEKNEAISNNESDNATEAETHRSNVRNLASALLQIEQAIERRFLKEPFGCTNKRDAKLELLKQLGEKRLQQWEISLMESTSYSQIFLHLNVLHDCILWQRSANKSICKVCRRGHTAEKMLLCDQCNGGTHMFCMKPKMVTVPKGNWYCHVCVQDLGLLNEQQEQKRSTARKKRKFVVDEVVEIMDESVGRIINDDKSEVDSDDEDVSIAHESYDSDYKINKVPGKKRAAPKGRSSRRLKSKEIEELMDDDTSEPADESSVNAADDEEDENNEEEEESTAEEEKVCQVCFYDGCEINCARCSESYHLQCVNLKRQTRAEFICKKCKPNETTRTRRRPSHVDSDDDNDEDDEQPQVKRSRSSRNSLRISLEKSAAANNNNNNNNNNTSHQNKNRRSGRRTNDNLPLNSAALYDLLEQTMKHQAAWPFLRPVLTSEVPDYHKIVKTPMDLAKIKSKLNMGNYQLNEELLNDIQLVFKNCDLYNVEGNEIYDAGCKLERFVIARCKDMMLPFRPSHMNAKQIC